MCKVQKRVYTDLRELNFKIEQRLQDQQIKLERNRYISRSNN